MPRLTPDRWLGLVTLLAALCILFIWIPLDVDSGLVDQVRRRLVIGDALAPSVAAVLLGLAGAALLLQPGPRDGPRFDRSAVLWCASLLLILILSFTLMRYTGPALTTLLGAGEYRLWRTTVPWSYAGFLTGGTVLIFGLISLVERRMRLARLLLAFTACLMMALFYDLPFDDLLLPPNGDV